jgi:hypothetical protein
MSAKKGSPPTNVLIPTGGQIDGLLQPSF